MKSTNTIERAIVGCMMANTDCADDGLVKLEAEDFYDEDCRRIFSAMECLATANTKIDFISVANMFNGEMATKVSEIYTEIYTTTDFNYYCNELIKASKLKQFSTALQEAYKKAQNDDEDCYIDIQMMLDKMNDKRSADMERISNVIPLALSDLSNPQKGIPTGFTQLDMLIKGMVKGNLVIVAGRPSMGKSAFAENIALNVARQGKIVAFFSLEMKSTEIAQRLLYMHNRVGEYEIMNSVESCQRVVDSLNDFNDLKFYTHDMGNLNISKLQTLCKRIKKREDGLDLVVIDYIGLMKTPQRKNGSRAQEVGEVSHALKQLAQEMDCTVIALAQLNRSSESRADHVPMLSDLRESGDIEQDADIVLFPFRPAVYDDEFSESQAELYIAKNRNGTVGKIDLYWSGECFLFDNPTDDYQTEYAESRYNKNEDDEDEEGDGCPWK